MTDGLSPLYQDLLTGSYDCVDRIILNAYFRMGHSPGGFHVWWQALTGSDDTLDNTHLMRMAGRFSRRIRGYAKRTIFLSSTAAWGNVNTTSQRNIWPRPRSPRGCFSSWWVAPKPRSGRSPGPIISNANSPC